MSRSEGLATLAPTLAPTLAQTLVPGLAPTPALPPALSASMPDLGDAAGCDGFDVTNFERLVAHDVPVDRLSADVTLRQDGTDASHVQQLVDAAECDEPQPILVQVDGWRVIDGVHRLHAARARGATTIKVRFIDCADSEALVIAMKSNASHGLPLTRADRVAGAQRILDAHPNWSDRAVAAISGLSAKTVATLRSRAASPGAVDSKRLGMDGRMRPVSPGDARRRVAHFIAANPHASLRTVARETDVSLGTVHDVSTRLRRGLDPERGGRRPATPGADHVGVAPLSVLRPSAAGDDGAVRPDRVPAPGPENGDVALGARARGGSGQPLPPALRSSTVSPQASWAAVAAKMAKDPAVCYTASGRDFLRWMHLHAVESDEAWPELVDAVPLHWLSAVAPIADQMAARWSLFAEHLKFLQETEH